MKRKRADCWVAANAGGYGVQRLDERRDHEAVAPRLERLDEPIGEHAAARGGTDEVVVEAISAPANRCARRQRVKACHAGILRAGQDLPVEGGDDGEDAIGRSCVADRDPEEPGEPGAVKWRTRIFSSRSRAATAAAVIPGGGEANTKFAYDGSTCHSSAVRRSLSRSRSRSTVLTIWRWCARSSSAAIAPAIAQRSTGYELRTALRSAISERSPSA